MDELPNKHGARAIARRFPHNKADWFSINGKHFTLTLADPFSIALNTDEVA